MALMEKQGYKQTEVGLIPEDWLEPKPLVEVLSEMTDFVAAGSFESLRESVKVYDFDNYAYYVRLVDIRAGLGHLSQKFVDKKSYDFLKRSNLHGGEILIANIGANVGEVFLMPSVEKPATIAPNMILMRTKDSILNSKFCYYFIDSETGQKLLSELIAGSGHPKLNKTDLKKLLVPLPPTLKEQKAIATALSDVDDLITNLDKLITKKKDIKQGAMQQLLSGKTRLKGFGFGVGYKDSDLGIIPEDWDVKLLPEVFDYIHGKAHEQHINEYGQYTVVNSKFISSEGKVSKHSSENFCKAKKGDILTVLSDLPNGKALAKTYYVEVNNKYAVNQRVCIWRAKKDDSKFLNYIMNRNKYFLKLDDGVTQTHILNHHIEKCPILIPKNIEEQKAIGDALQEMERELVKLETKKAKYQAIKQGMMQELLTGKTRLL